ncbi:hypothetical protein [Bradyrhizobium sp. DASA03120]|uniref:hypothetical protein n=1 Tax=Bradyrhizobium sp. SMVTL-02 TaxID=3395917 RepID=UPI003F6FB4B3
MQSSLGAHQNARLQKKLKKQADAVISFAIESLGRGRLDEAETLCREILKEGSGSLPRDESARPARVRRRMARGHAIPARACEHARSAFARCAQLSRGDRKFWRGYRAAASERIEEA